MPVFKNDYKSKCRKKIYVGQIMYVLVTSASPLSIEGGVEQ